LGAVDDRAYWEERARRHGRAADGYLDPRRESYEHLARWAAFRRLCTVSRGQSVLDAGCGTGRWATALAKLGCEVEAADISETMIQMAEPHLGVRYRVSAVEDLDYPDGRFDLALSVTVLQHITDPVRLERAMTNLHRMLKPSGSLFVIEFSPLRLRPTAPHVTYMQYRTHKQWIELIETAHFRLNASSGIHFLGHRMSARWLAFASRLESGPRGAEAQGSIRRVPTSFTFDVASKVDGAAARIPGLNMRSDLHGYRFERSQ
jgi:2-polyprenyl-3-methyl-5-hydroxy-6-metoxy-1,4-benzoquinol methylase